MTASPSRRALRGLLRADRRHPTEPPARDGYSVAQRALAGLLGVRLLTPDEQAGSPAARTSPGEDDQISTAAAIAAADPVVRLTVRQSPLVAAVPMADLLLRAVDIANNLRPSRGRVEDSNLARARTLSYDLIRDLTRAFDLARDRDLNRDLNRNPNRDPKRTVDLARALAFVRDLDLASVRYLDRDLACDLTRIFTLARTDVGVGGRAVDFGADRDRDLILFDRNLDLVLALGRAFTRDRAHELAFVLAGTLSDSLGIKHHEGLTAALLNGALDDFSQADLSGVDLAHIDLVGVQWSVSGTRWPIGLDVETLMQQSEETEPGSGIYVITRRGETERVGEDVRI